ncbi:hypothetical protein EV44_g6463 [Erysiphe necator]|uniref:Uncharacterized protein n=1 Tax=Uncinula necator TaxID=52586 RepID=A0A0B1NZM7_UNCNE|nr:hypothetical protein EV44_g6463 [Erysiphe necator]
MEPASRNFRGDTAFAERQKLNHVTRTARTLSPKRDNTENRSFRQAIDPRWDPFSGEITSSDKGKPQSVKPKTFGISLRQVDGRKGTTSDFKTPTPVVERIRKLNSRPSVETLEGRSPSFISSSTTAFVSNVEILTPETSSGPEVDIEIRPQSRPGLVTQKSNSTMGKIPVQNSETRNQVPKFMSSDKDLANSTHEKSSTYNKYEAGADTKKEENTIISSDTFSPKSAKVEDKLSSKEPRPSIESNSTSQLLITELEFPKNHIRSSPPVTSENTDHAVQAPSPNNLNINSSIDAKKLTRMSNHKVDKPLIKTNAPVQQDAIVINRVRPSDLSPKLHRITRKAVPPGSPIFISMSIPPNMNANERHLLTKTLPLTPAENSSNDLVTVLQAHLDSLAHRRRNITRSIRQMTELMPRDNLLITDEVRLKREHEKRKVAMLREEEAEIKREEHEVGLRLHRAWKRTESGAVYEPTSLWVRRVTGVGKNWSWPNQDLPVC